MNPRWLAAPALFLLAGCGALNPAAAYKQAARQLKFSLDKVDPSIQLAYPLEQSRLNLRLTLGVENPTQVRFRARSIAGAISLDSDGVSHGLGHLEAPQGLDLKPSARTPVTVDITLPYGSLKEAWSALRMVSVGARPGTWRLDGEAGLEAMGVPFTVPLRVQKRMSGQ